jgi:hypothetical protein
MMNANKQKDSIILQMDRVVSIALNNEYF